MCTIKRHMGAQTGPMMLMILASWELRGRALKGLGFRGTNAHKGVGLLVVSTLHNVHASQPACNAVANACQLCQLCILHGLCRPFAHSSSILEAPMLPHRFSLSDMSDVAFD